MLDNSRDGLGKYGALPCVRACVCVSVHVSVEGWTLWDCPAPLWSGQSPRLQALNRGPLPRSGGWCVGAEEPLGVRVRLELGSGPVTQPWGKWGPWSRCPVNTHIHNSHTHTWRSTLRDIHTEHNTHPCHTLTNRTQTHIPQTLTGPSPHPPSTLTHSHPEGEHMTPAHTHTRMLLTLGPLEPRSGSLRPGHVLWG